MEERRSSSIAAAIGMLLEEIEAEIHMVDKTGSEAFGWHDHERAREALERVTDLAGFRERVAALREEWAGFAAAAAEVQEQGSRETGQPRLGRLGRGLRTREETYCRPIPQALVDLGGSARMEEVLRRIEPLLTGILNNFDHEPLASEPEVPRWRNSAQWARHAMVRGGLLKPDSRRGVWEITEDGRRALSGGRLSIVHGTVLHAVESPARPA